jgi:serine/threonine protein kinase
LLPKVSVSPFLLKARIGEEELTLDKTIGTGSFGEVYSGYWRGTRVAIKRMLVNVKTSDSAAIDDFIQEANLMSNFRHPNIIQVSTNKQQQSTSIACSVLLAY